MKTLLAVELFHLVFLRHLGERLDKNLYALKGGCNLRFYFKSIRYSEDIDIDVLTASNRHSALQQKISALINRSEIQARDIFDLILLSRAGGVIDRELWNASDCERAREHALSIGFDHFKGQVVAYLEPNYQSYYDSSAVWNTMVEELVNKVLR